MISKCCFSGLTIHFSCYFLKQRLLNSFRLKLLSQLLELNWFQVMVIGFAVSLSPLSEITISFDNGYILILVDKISCWIFLKFDCENSRKLTSNYVNGFSRRQAPFAELADKKSASPVFSLELNLYFQIVILRVRFSCRHHLSFYFMLFPIWYNNILYWILL